MVSRSITSFIVLLCLLLAAQPGWSQESRASITGRVTDSSGAVVPGVTIHLRHVASGVSRTAVSNASGNYSAPLLDIGAWELTTESKGFKPYGRQLQLRTGDDLEVNIALEIGAMTESVTITAETPILETSSSSVGQVVDGRRVADLPITMGLTYQLIRLAPASAYTGSFWADQPWEPESNASFTMAGSSATSAEITMDGASVATSKNGGGGVIPAGSPPADLVAEFKVQTVDFSGTAGITQGGTVSISLKQGTNKLHGTALYQNQPQRLTANQWFSNRNNVPPAPAKVNRWGGTANGPVWIPKVYNGKNRSFFVFSYEGTHYNSARGTNFTMPTAAQRAGDFSQLLAISSQYQIYNPFSARTASGGRIQRDPIAGNIVSSVRPISPIATKLLNTRDYPLPTTNGDTVDGSNNMPEPGASQTVFHHNTWYRFDHNISDKQRAFVRWQKSRTLWNDPPFWGLDSMYRNTHFNMENSSYAFDHVYVWNPTLVMNIRASDARNRRASWANLADLGVNLTSTYGFPQYFNDATPANYRHTPMINLNSFTTFGGSSYSNQQFPHENRAIAVSFEKMRGVHSFKFGFEHRQYIANAYSWGGGAEGGSFSFNETYTRGPLDNSPTAPRGQDFAALLLGQPTSGNFQYVDSYAELSREYYGYLQDDWKVTRKLTLNLSVRYELVGPQTERYNRSIGGYDPTASHSGNFDALTLAAYTANPTPERPASTWSTTGGVTFPGVNGQPRELTNRDWNNIMPRVGFAYSMDKNTVWRGGYGQYFGPLGNRAGDVSLLAHSRTTNLIPSNDNGLTFIANLADPYPITPTTPNRFLPIVGSSLGADTLLGQSVGTPFTRNVRASRTQKWQLSVQRQLPGRFMVELGYIGSRGDQNMRSVDQRYFPSQYLSRSPLRDQASIDYWGALVPNPFAGLLPGTSMNSGTIARSNLVRTNPQFSSLSLRQPQDNSYSQYHALTVRMERRFSQGFTVMGFYTFSKQMDTTNFRYTEDLLPQHELSSGDRPHILNVSFIYELPFGRGRKFFANNPVASAIVGGWQVSTIWTVQSATPYGFGDVIYYGGDLRDVVLPVSERTVDRFFKTDLFEKANNKQLSNHYNTSSPRYGFLRGSRMNYYDMSVIKNTRITEGTSAQFRVEALNAFNQVLWAGPNTTPSSTSFGKISSESSAPRRIQMTLKFIF